VDNLEWLMRIFAERCVIRSLTEKN